MFCLIDFGMMGTVDDERIGELLEFLVGLLTGDMDRVVTLFHRLGLVDDHVDVRALKSECRAILDRYGNQTLESIDIATFLTEVFDTVRRHHVALPSDLLIMAKSVVTMEGIAQELHPEFDPLAEMRTYLLRIYTKKTMDPKQALKGLYGTVDAYSYLLQRLPREVESIATKLRKGELTIRLDESERLRSARAGERALNRLAMAILYLATAVCSTMLLVFPLGPEFLGVPATTILGMLGLVLALGLGASRCSASCSPTDGRRPPAERPQRHRPRKAPSSGLKPPAGSAPCPHTTTAKHPTPGARLRALARLATPVALARLGIMGMGIADTVVVGHSRRPSFRPSRSAGRRPACCWSPASGC